MSEKLTPKQQAFVREYLLDWNATQAAIRAGYSPHTAQQIASENLSKPVVQEAIAEARRTLEAKAEVEAVRVIHEQAAIAFSDLGQVLDFTGNTLRLRPPAEIPEPARRAIASIKVRRHVEGHGDNAREVEVTEIRFWSKSDALDKLARILGLYAPEKVAPTTPEGDRPYEVPTLEAVLDRLALLADQAGTNPSGR